MKTYDTMVPVLFGVSIAMFHYVAVLVRSSELRKDIRRAAAGRGDRHRVTIQNGGVKP